MRSSGVTQEAIEGARPLGRAALVHQYDAHPVSLGRPEVSDEVLLHLVLLRRPRPARARETNVLSLRYSKKWVTTSLSTCGAREPRRLHSRLLLAQKPRLQRGPEPTPRPQLLLVLGASVLELDDPMLHSVAAAARQREQLPHLVGDVEAEFRIDLRVPDPPWSKACSLSDGRRTSQDCGRLCTTFRLVEPS